MRASTATRKGHPATCWRARAGCSPSSRPGPRSGLLAAERKERPPSHYRFDADGWAHFAESGAPLEKIVDAYLTTKEWGQGLFGFRDLDDAQISYSRQFLMLARRLDVKVIVYVPPLYPRAVAFYGRETSLPALRTQLVEHLRAWQAGGLIAAVHDFTRVESFGCDTSEFHDLAHHTEAASRRMLDLMLRPLPQGRRVLFRSRLMTLVKFRIRIISVQKLGSVQSVFLPGYIDQEDGAALYSLATAFTYPSLWEGLGPPVFENPVLRADLSGPGRRLAAQFSWERCARETLAVYEAVVG